MRSISWYYLLIALGTDTDAWIDGWMHVHAHAYTHTQKPGGAGLQPVLTWFKKVFMTVHSQIPCTAYTCIIHVSLTERKGHAFKRLQPRSWCGYSGHSHRRHHRRCKSYNIYNHIIKHSRNCNSRNDMKNDGINTICPQISWG